MATRKAAHFNVKPRYTPGSPGMVDETLALRVAAQEKDSYETCLTGIYGEEMKAKAEREGLFGIAEEVRETRKGWEVRDLITRETYLRPFRKNA